MTKVRCFAIFGLVLFTAFNFCLFLSGYRLTADDVAFHQFALDGISEVLEFTKQAAFNQGRVVHFIDIPFSVFGSFYSDVLWFRVFYTLIFFGDIFLIAYFLSRIFENLSLVLLFLLYMVMLPLDFYHLPPNSYPAHLSIPVTLILLSRITFFNVKDKMTGGFAWKLFASITFLLGLLFSEYGFVFGAAIILVEYGVKTPRFTYAGVRDFVCTSNNKYIIRSDFACISIFLVSYLVFRGYYPSSYEGNQLGQSSPLQFLFTTIGHIYGGLSISSVQRNFNQIKELLQNNPYYSISAAVIFLCSSALLYAATLLSKPIVGYKKAIILLAAATVIVTVPVSVTEKYQSWCVSIDACIFVDSRLSYLFFVPCLAILIQNFVSNINAIQRITTSIIIILISALAVLACNANYIISKKMQDYVAVWERAKVLSCIDQSEINILNFSFDEVIDPKRSISYHTGFDIKKYWGAVVEHLKHNRECDSKRSVSDLYQVAKLNQLVNFNSENSVSFLRKGWSSIEPWGIWSNAEHASILVPLSCDAAVMTITYSPFVHGGTGQSISIFVNDQYYETVVNNSPTVDRIIVPLNRFISKQCNAYSIIKLEFVMPNATTPASLGLSNDPRKLGIGLVSLLVE